MPLTTSSSILSIKIELCPLKSRSGTKYELYEGKRTFIGSAANDDICLHHEGIQSRHACFTVSEGRISIASVDRKPVSINGKPIIVKSELKNGDWLVLGSTTFNVHLLNAPVEREQTSTPNHPIHSLPQNQTITIGRLKDCELFIESPIVSRQHARINFQNEHWLLEDLGSTNGTFLNGKKIGKPVILNPGDQIGFAIFSYLFTGEELQPLGETGRIRIEVRDLYKEVRDRTSKQSKRLLERINLVIEPGEFVGIFGTSGSGKSTLMDALNGRRPATSGQVLYNGSELYDSFDCFKSTIGYVPQQDIVHRKITMRNALMYTARLRLPPDTSNQEIDEYISNVLQQVGLSEKADLPVDTPVPLSGGQLKRVSLAVELVANPNLLFLDEVTSGLDAGTDKKMMRLFSELASTGKTVICVTHTLESIDHCDLVVLLHQGRMVYFGPPGEAPAYFGIERLSDVYELLESSNRGEWADRFQTSEMYQRYICSRLSDTVEPEHTINTGLKKTRRQISSYFEWKQTATLVHRYWDLMLSDRKNLAITLLQAPLIAAVIGGVFTIDGSIHEQAISQSQIVFILVLSAIWFGCLNSAREVVKELPIYLRERSVSLHIAPYLSSKLIPLAGICIIQCTALLGIVSYLIPLTGHFNEQLLVLFLAGMAATTMGLTVSTFVDTNDKAVATIPILLIPQVILSNAVVPLENSGELFAKFTMISFWAYDGLKATLERSTLSTRDPQGNLLVPVVGDYSSDINRIGVFFALFLVFSILGLMLKDQKK